MQKRVSVPISGLIVLIVLAICGYVYTRLPIGPNINPMMPKGSNKPPGGLGKHMPHASKSKKPNAPTAAGGHQQPHTPATNAEKGAAETKPGA
ncbi:MAG: hypothetical protein ACYC96_08600 [Fimbriimonadaceae bacterium]